MRHCGVVLLFASLPVVLFASGCTSQSDECENGKCGTASLAVTSNAAASAPQVIAPVAYAVSPRVIDLPPIESKPEDDFDEESKVGPPKTFRAEDPLG
jgi:hypothetical protein